VTTKKSSSCVTQKKTSYLFHPYEIAFCGYSNSGKTTLISKLIKSLKSKYTIGYIKHDVHKFQMDKEGKDTFVSWNSGATQILISDSKHTASIHKNSPDLIESKTSFLNCDIAFLEGYKNSSAKKLVIIDQENKIFNAIKTGEIDHVIGFIGQGPKPQSLPLDLPYFQRDDIGSIAQWIQDFQIKRVKEIPLYGLVLAGGHSTRMKKDKALLKYSDKTQAEAGYELLSSFCESTFISSRFNQWSNQTLNHLPQIHDRFLDFGPMGGILSAMQTHPHAAWLVIACDLPYLDKNTIQFLIKNRNPFKMASCYKSKNSDFPEPLCSIYEPKILLRLLQFLGLGYQCPRKVLIQSPTQLLEQPYKSTLENINFNDEYIKTKKQIEARIVQ